MVLLLLLFSLPLSAAQLKRPDSPHPMKPTPKLLAPTDTKQKHKEAKKRHLSVIMEGNYVIKKLEY